MKQTKGILLAAFFAVAAFVGGAVGYNQYVVTRFGDLRCTDILLDGNDILDSAGTTRITVGATNAVVGNVTVSGNLTVSGTSYYTIVGSTAPRDTSATIGITPTAIAQLVWNATDKELCVSTGATRFTWVRVSTPTVACAH